MRAGLNGDDMQEREEFLDKLRVAATCAVVLLHTITGVTSSTDMSTFPFEYKVFLAALDLICWCVPVFVLISGYLFLNPAREISMWDMLAKYCRRIVLALFLFGVPYACLEQVALEHTFKINMLGKGFLMVLRGESWAHMWYLYLILVLYLITPALKWLLERIPRPAVYAFLGALLTAGSILPCLAAFLEWKYPTALLSSLIYLFYYMCGYLFAVRRNTGVREEENGAGPGEKSGEQMRHRAEPGEKSGEQAPHRAEQEKICCDGRMAEAQERRRRTCTWILPGAAAVLALGMAVSRLFGIQTALTAYNDPRAVLLALLLFGSGFAWSRGGRKSAENTAKNTGLWKQRQASALTFTVYLVHPVFLNIFYKFLHITPLDFNIWVSLPLFSLGTLLFSTAAAWLLRRIPVLRRYVL